MLLPPPPARLHSPGRLQGQGSGAPLAPALLRSSTGTEALPAGEPGITGMFPSLRLEGAPPEEHGCWPCRPAPARSFTGTHGEMGTVGSVSAGMCFH